LDFVPLNGLNEAQRLIDLNFWNGHQYSLGIERLERFERPAFLVGRLPWNLELPL